VLCKEVRGALESIFVRFLHMRVAQIPAVEEPVLQCKRKYLMSEPKCEVNEGCQYLLPTKPLGRTLATRAIA
jgi:hypothetical protein